MGTASEEAGGGGCTGGLPVININKNKNYNKKKQQKIRIRGRGRGEYQLKEQSLMCRLEDLG